MKNLPTLALLASLALPAQAASPASPSWSPKMKQMFELLGETLSDVSSDERFNDAKVRRKLEANAKKLSQLAHDIKDSSREAAPAKPDQDPSLAIFAQLFAAEADRAYHALRNGHGDYARDLIRSIPGYCISCHTRNAAGSPSGGLPMPEPIKQLKTLERAEFFAASRQFDRAWDELKKAMDDGALAKARPFEWIKGARLALSISVRAKRDPDRALEITDKILASSSAPFYFKQNAAQWKKSLQDWKKEPKTEVGPESQDAESVRKEAIRLLNLAHDTQKYPADQSADMIYLRASAAVHDLLMKTGDGPKSADALFMAGLSYEPLRPYPVGEVHEIYFESCIRRSPHTPLAENCYAKYEEAIFDGFTGSSGTNIPRDVQDRLKQLESLAQTPELAPAQH
jgi:hypothetical protein